LLLLPRLRFERKQLQLRWNPFMSSDSAEDQIMMAPHLLFRKALSSWIIVARLCRQPH